MRWLRALLVGIAFSTRLPVRVGAVTPTELAEGLACFPIVGLAIGAACFGAYSLSAPMLGPTLAAVIAVACCAWITGGLHLDGVADWFDALGGGRGDRQRMLEIMRDSRIGAHGAVALVLVLLAKVAVLAELPHSQRVLALCGAPAAARLAAICLLYCLPSARADGLGRGMAQDLRGPHVAVACATYLMVALWLGSESVLPSIGAAAAGVAVGWQARSKLGGVTGDVCGASIELSELAFLLAMRAAAA
jgi:adenosylcobinamide-GDP ribazoletransferase